MKSNIRTLAAVAATALCTLPCLASTEAADTPYAAMSFLVGHCWKGTFPGSAIEDEHCFSWVYGGKFVRDRHVVQRGPGKPPGYGESLYFWDSTARELHYLYLESEGGFSRGTVVPQDDALVFPAARYVEGGVQQTVRSRWTRRGEDAYEVRTEFLVKGRWTPGFPARMERVADAPAAD